MYSLPDCKPEPCRHALKLNCRRGNVGVDVRMRFFPGAFRRPGHGEMFVEPTCDGKTYPLPLSLGGHLRHGRAAKASLYIFI